MKRYKAPHLICRLILTLVPRDGLKKQVLKVLKHTLRIVKAWTVPSGNVSATPHGCWRFAHGSARDGLPVRQKRRGSCGGLVVT